MKYIIDDISHIGIVEEVVQEARSIILLEMLIVSKRSNAQSITESPESQTVYHLANTSLVSLSSTTLLGVGSKKKLSSPVSEF